MKLVIKEHCVVAGGRIAERGQIYTTTHPDPKTDQEAYTLIAAGRAVVADSAEGKVILDEVAVEVRDNAKTPAKK